MIAMLVTNRGFDDPRVVMEAQALACAHRDVTVVGWDRDADSSAQDVREGVRFVRIALRSEHGRGITQPLFLGGYYLRAMSVLRGLRPRAIHCHDLDTLPLGHFAARRLRSRLVFDAHENYPDMMVGHLPRKAVAALRRLERRLAPRCDALVTVGGRLADHYRGMGCRNVTVVGNWKDAEEFEFAPAQLQRRRGELGLQGRIVIGFIANLGRERRLGPLLEAVAADGRFAALIGGDGPQAPLVRRWAAECTRVVYLGRVPPAQVPALTALCDVIYYGFDESNPNAQWSAPNKLYEAIAAGKPVLTGRFGEIGDTVERSGCGVLADTSSADGIAAALAELADADQLERMARAARSLQSTLSRRAAATALRGLYGSLLAMEAAA